MASNGSHWRYWQPALLGLLYPGILALGFEHDRLLHYIDDWTYLCTVSAMVALGGVALALIYPTSITSDHKPFAFLSDPIATMWVTFCTSILGAAICYVVGIGSLRIALFTPWILGIGAFFGKLTRYLIGLQRGKQSGVNSIRHENCVDPAIDPSRKK